MLMIHINFFDISSFRINQKEEINYKEFRHLLSSSSFKLLITENFLLKKPLNHIKRPQMILELLIARATLILPLERRTVNLTS